MSTSSYQNLSMRGPSLPSLPEYVNSNYQAYLRPDLQKTQNRELLKIALATCQEAAKLARDGTGNKSRLSIMKGAKENQRQMLEEKLPRMTKQETKNHRRSRVENVYIDVLQNGYFKSFEEIFYLVSKDAENRLKGGPDSILWLRIPLAEQRAKLEMMSRFLKESEDAIRQGDYGEVYSCNFALAKFLQAKEDRLSDHFFENCLKFSKLIHGDEGKKTAEAHCYVGLAAERRGDLTSALENMSAYYKLSKGRKSWLTSAGQLMHVDACSELTRVFSAVAQNFQDEGCMTESLEHFAKAFNIAEESEDVNLINEVSYKLGLACHKNGDAVSALKHLENYLESCLQADDKEGLSKAYDAIALTYQGQGKTDEAIASFQEYTKVAEEMKDDKAIAKASLHLGALHNCIGNYLQSAGYFIKAFSVSQSEGSDRVLINASRVQYGISVGHRMLSRYTRHLEQDSLPSWERLLDWKECKKNEFDKPISDRPPEVRREVRRLLVYRLEKEEKAKEKKSVSVSSTKKPRRASMYVRRPSETGQ